MPCTWWYTSSTSTAMRSTKPPSTFPVVQKPSCQTRTACKGKSWRTTGEREKESWEVTQRGVQVNTKSEKVSSTEYLFNKMTTLPVHMKTLYISTSLSKCRPWLDTFSSFLFDLHLGIQILNKAFGCSSLSLRDGSWSWCQRSRTVPGPWGARAYTGLYPSQPLKP